MEKLTESRYETPRRIYLKLIKRNHDSEASARKYLNTQQGLNEYVAFLEGLHKELTNEVQRLNSTGGKSGENICKEGRC